MFKSVNMKATPRPSFRPGPRILSAVRPLLIIAGYVLLYIALSKLAIVFRSPYGSSPWYPSHSLSLVLLLIFGLRYAPALLLPPLIIMFWLCPPRGTGGAMWMLAFIIMLGYSGTAALLRSVLRLDTQLHRMRDVISFILVAVLAPFIVAALAMANWARIGLVPWSDYFSAVVTWWIGDAIGLIILTPFLLVYAVPLAKVLMARIFGPDQDTGRRGAEWPGLHYRALPEILLQITSVIFIVWVVFVTPLKEFHLYYLCFLPLIWMALRHGLPGASIGILVLSVSSMVAARALSFKVANVIDLQLLMLVLSLTGLLLGAVTTEHWRAEERFFKAFQASPSPMSIVALREGRCIDLNDSFLRISGYTRRDVVNRPVDELGIWAAPEERTQVIRQLTEHGAVRDLEVHLRLKSAGERIHLLSAEVIDLGGEKCALCILNDITERKWAEAERNRLLVYEQKARAEAEAANHKHSELLALLDALLAATPIGLAFLDPSLCYLRLNQAMAAMNGIPWQEHLGRTVRELRPALAPMLEPILRRVLVSGEPVLNLEFSGETPTVRGQRRHYLASYYPVRAPEGQILGVGAAVMDVTQHKQVDDQLQFQATILENVQDSVIVTDLEGKVVYWNEGARVIFGYSAEEMLGKSVAVLHPDQNQEQVTVDLNNILKGNVYRDEWQGRRKDGMPVWVDVKATVMHDAAGQVTGFIGVAKDITQRKHLEQERVHLFAREQAARQQAETANRIKDEFLATLSHELRTPLNAILGWTHLLRSGQLDPAMSAQAIETIERNARSQAQLIEDLLDISRIITGKLRLNIRSIELIPVIQAAIAMVRPAVDAKGIYMESALDPEVTPISGDSNRLQQVIWNLLSNAVRFTPRGGYVQIRLEHRNDHTVITVQDTGQGIHPEFLPYIFDRFRQADSSTARAHGGLGLGLSIVRHLVELHGGTVRAASPGEGQGATFTVQLPLRIPRPEEPRSRPMLLTAPSRPRLGRPPVLEGLQVLVVDDEADGRRFLTLMLRQCGASVVEAGSTREALAAIDRYKPDVLVSDIGMPGEDGYALIRQVRALSPERGGRLPAVALTGYARDADRQQVLLAGYQRHMSKPVDPDRLVGILAHLMEGTGQVSQEK